MTTRPYFRTIRNMNPKSSNRDGGRSYILHPLYAPDARDLIRAFSMIEKDLKELFEFIEPSEESQAAFSFRIHALLARTCMEVESNFRAILIANDYNESNRKNLNMGDYWRVEFSHHLSSYEAKLPIWYREPRTFRPFKPWEKIRHRKSLENSSLDWFQAYNASKHGRHLQFKDANLLNLVTAVSGLAILLASQFGDEDFSGRQQLVSVGPPESLRSEFVEALGELFRIKYPKDWGDAELYDFNWSDLRELEKPFQRFSYDEITA